MKKEYQALDLFGGREKVLKRMRQRVRDALSSKAREVQEDFLREMELTPSKGVRQIAEMGYKALRPAAAYLDVNLTEELGSPQFRGGNNKGYWDAQMRQRPMMMSGTPPRNRNRDTERRFYLKNRAIGELVQAA